MQNYTRDNPCAYPPEYDIAHHGSPEVISRPVVTREPQRGVPLPPKLSRDGGPYPSEFQEKPVAIYCPKPQSRPKATPELLLD